jgi:protein-S-isoprenylcysteine O-methyltransferase Ste14
MKKLPGLLLSASLIIAIAISGYLKLLKKSPEHLQSNTLPCILFWALYLAWMLFELRVAFREQGVKYTDYGTREFYGVCHAATALSALWFTPAGGPTGIALAAGTVIFLVGVTLRVWAILTLGRFYSHSVRLIADHQIVDTGPYRKVRHPAYSGMLLAHAGVVIFCFNLPVLAVYLLGLLPAIIIRIRVEERTLLLIPGYREFARTRRRLLPKIW